MARFPLQFQATDQQKKIIVGGTVTLTLTGTDTVATCYTASAGGTAISLGQQTTDSNGRVKYWVDETDYTPLQYFRITMSGNEFVTQTWDDVIIFPATSADAASSSAAASAAAAAASANAVADEYVFSDTTSMADPGTGIFRLNNATVSSVTAIAMNDATNATGNPDISSYLTSIDDGTNTSHLAYLTVRHNVTLATYALFSVTGLTDNSGWVEYAVTHVASTGTWSDTDDASISFSRSGNRGINAGLSMNFEDTTTDTDQGAGKVWLNHATPSSATVLYMDDADVNGTDINSYIDSWDNATGVTNGEVMISKQSDPAVFALYTVTGSVTSASTYSKVTVTYVTGAGSFTDTDPASVVFIRTGNRGEDAGLNMVFDDTTTDTDQGAGKMWLNHATVASATVLYMDDVDANATSINSLVDSWDDSDGMIKGEIKFAKNTDTAIFAIFNVTGEVTSASTYSKIAVTYVTGAGSFTDADEISVSFTRAGDLGVGAGLKMNFDITTIDTDQGAGKVWLNNGTPSAATVFYVDDVDVDSTSVNSFVDSWDDSSSSIKGEITITKRHDTAVFAKYNVTGAVTSASTYSKVAVTYITGAGSFTDADLTDITFVRSGDKGDAAGVDMTFEDTTTDTDQGVGKTWLNHATPSSATVFYMDDVDINSADVNTMVDSWDDSTTTIAGTITMKKKADNAVFAIYNVTGAVTSASTYSKVAVTYVTGSGSFTDADPVSVEFSRSGNDGIDGSGSFDFSTTANPTANSDMSNTDGNGTFTVGSHWTNTTTNKTWHCVDSTATAAIWASAVLEGTEVKSTGEGGGSKYLREDGDGTCSWQTVTGGGLSLGTDSIIRTNLKTIDENITFVGNENGSTVGPITISSGYTVTVTSGSTWTII